MKHDSRLVWLDLVRGASAIAVAAGHLRNATLIDYRLLTDPSPLTKALYLLTGLQSQAVLVFFVLSGFFVGGQIVRYGSNFDSAEYAVARLTRLWAVLIPSLGLTFAIDSVVATRAPEVLRGEYYAFWSSGPSQAGYSASAWTFLGNLAFLQGILAPVFGTNGPLWSLAYEFWYYATFPLLAISAGLAAQRYSTVARSACAAVAIAVLCLMPDGLLEGYVAWLFGVAVYVAVQDAPARRRPMALAASIAFFAGTIAYSKALPTPSIGVIPAGWITALAFSPVCAVLATWPAMRMRWLAIAVGSLAKGLAETSYSLYLSHFPLLILIAAVGYKFRKVSPNPSGCLLYFATLAALIAFGIVFWLLFERHTTAIRRAARKYLLGR